MNVTGCQPIKGDGFEGFACYTGNNSLAAIRERFAALSEDEVQPPNEPPASDSLGALTDTTNARSSALHRGSDLDAPSPSRADR